jgi:uncharacterized membrane protein YcaP (DUF421 family)
MDPLRIGVRIVFAYLVLLLLVRVSGKRTVKQGSPFDFTVALIIGDMMDDLIWAEVDASKFVVAAGVLVLVHTAFDLIRYRSGASS